MQISLTIPERLKDLRTERGLDIAEVAKATGISSSALSNHENDEGKDISHRAILALAKFYGVSADYLLGLTEAKNHPNADLDDLHLSDDVIGLLKSGRINNRLLCELVGHKDFQRLMVDMEIYVDRIANMRIHDMNTLLAAERRTIMEKMKLDGTDVNIRALELAQIDSDEYFAHVIYDDLRPILHDIRAAHEIDTTTADTDSPAEDAIRQIEDVVSGEGSAQEKQVRILLSQLGIDYDALTTDEFVTLVGIKMYHGHMYLTAVIDWFSRKIVGWTLSDTLDTQPVLEAVQSAVECCGVPAILNSDQGSQFTSEEYKQFLKSLHIRQSMDGKSRWADNIMIERWFRSLKTELIYINEYRSPKELRTAIRGYTDDYNTLRPHEALDYATPDEVYKASFAASGAA